MTIENVAAVAAPAAAPAAPVAAPVGAATAVATAVPTVAAPAPVAATAAPAGAFGAVVEYEPTGHAGLDIALSFLGGHGLGPDHAGFKVAAETGDFSILKAALAAKGIPGWEQHLALAEGWHAEDKAAKAAATGKIGEMCVAVAGTSEDWQAVMDWAAANVEGDEKSQINAALAGGGLQAEAMAHYLVNGFRQAPGTTYEGKSAVQANAGAAAPAVSNAPLDPRAYGAEVMKLHTKLGNRMQGSQELAALDRRRMAFRG